MKSAISKLRPIESTGSPFPMINLLSDKGFQIEWVKDLSTFAQIEDTIFSLVMSYKGTSQERIKIFHMIQIWGGYSGHHIYIDNPSGFSWDTIDSYYKKLIDVCKSIADTGEESRKKVYDAIVEFNSHIKHIGVSFITKHVRFWLYSQDMDKMLPIYDSIMATQYFGKKGCYLKDLPGYWEKMCNDKNRGGRTLCQYERDLYNEFKPHKGQKRTAMESSTV